MANELTTWISFGSFTGAGEAVGGVPKVEVNNQLRLDSLDLSRVSSIFGVGDGRCEGAGLRPGRSAGLAVAALGRDDACLVARGPTNHGSCRGMMTLARLNRSATSRLLSCLFTSEAIRIGVLTLIAGVSAAH